MNESRAIAGPAPYSIWSGTPYHFHFNSRTREACDSPACRDSTRREHVAIHSGVRSEDRLPAESRAVTRPVVWSRAALRHRLPRSREPEPLKRTGRSIGGPNRKRPEGGAIFRPMVIRPS